MKSKVINFLVSIFVVTACTPTATPTPEKIEPQPTMTETKTPTTKILPPTWTPTSTLAPTHTPTLTLSATTTISPTKVHTATSKPVSGDVPLNIDLAATTIQLSDLPHGFEEVETDEQDFQYVPLEEEIIAEMESVFYTNRQTRCSVLSASFAFVDLASQMIFDYSIDHIEEVMEQRFDELGLSELGLEIDLELLSDFPPVGDKSVAMELEIGFNQITALTELAMFRHEGYGGVVLILPSSTDPDSVNLSELTLLQYNRMLTILGGGS